MAQSKLMVSPNSANDISSSRFESTASLRLQLQQEIDKLALLIEEVKKQSDRVQATADAIADRILLETPRQYSRTRRSSGMKSVNGPGPKAIPISGGPSLV